ncbi:DUF4391 domain-containing protein [Chitinispirillales bacterium ANBcel5]|uniref:DUF4391 domain-containing protein n=1 Tax=Cellulosispirillum alkaliphilum TaxID=3039283 RepID=UPI002A52404F|nr:DUF4391 domain-containing protein [Chitinispirillales bacterium ANBcel5]
MSGCLFEYPKQAYFGRIVPKSKIYAHARPSGSVKNIFIRQIEQITWKYKLALKTINIPETSVVPEIQIFTIALREKELKPEALRCIDLAVQFPVIFELLCEDQIKVVAAYKYLDGAGSGKCRVTDYFESEWVSGDTERKQIPLALNLEVLYGALLEPLLPFPARAGESLQERVERIGKIREKQREIERCEARLLREKQFNRKVVINTELREMREEIGRLGIG